jgi:hypothetical protein
MEAKMRWLVTLAFLAVYSMKSTAMNPDEGISVYPSQAQYAPTTPQVQAPKTESGKPPATPAQVAPTQVAGNGNSPCTGCTNKKNCAQKFYSWITYRPSAGDALPLLKVPPYTGPFTGTFLCTSAPGSPCAGNSNSTCGKKQGCASGNSSTPPAGPVVEKANPGLGAINLVPQVNQGYPSRNCQGGSVQLSDPSFPGSTREIPLNPDISESGETTIPVENVDFKPVSCNDSDSSVSQAEFIAAVLTARQVLSPMELLTRSYLRP